MFSLLMAGLCLVMPVTLTADSKESPRGTSPAEESEYTSSASPAEFLPDSVAGIKATGETRLYSLDSISDLIGERAAAAREYRVVAAASRPYGDLRVDVFLTESVFAAFGLFTYEAGVVGAKSVHDKPGYDSAGLPGERIFWKDRYVVRVLNPTEQGPVRGLQVTLVAAAIAKAFGSGDAESMRPSLLKSLPGESTSRLSERYFLGPESLSLYVAGAREMFDFAGRAEAVLAEYPEGATDADTAVRKESSGSHVPNARPPTAVKLLIVECHTPQFATDAFARASGYLASLSDDQKQATILEREGNYIVQANGFESREFAQQLVDSVEYQYTVKWLRDPLLPTNDPWRAQKAAQMLVSSFGVIGLMLLAVLVGGGAFGTAVFMKRRKRQREVFSDAGGMLRLDLEPFNEVLLGLPPARTGEE